VRGGRSRVPFLVQDLQHDRLAHRLGGAAVLTWVASSGQLKTNIDSGIFQAVQWAGIEALNRWRGGDVRACEVYAAATCDWSRKR